MGNQGESEGMGRWRVSKKLAEVASKMLMDDVTIKSGVDEDDSDDSDSSGKAVNTVEKPCQFELTSA